jgi:hypothetical protein
MLNFFGYRVIRHPAMSPNLSFGLGRWDMGYLIQSN